MDRARKKADAAADRLMKELLAKIETAVTAKGAEGAIEVCNKAAPELTAQIDAAEGVSVRRTALRLRNKTNAPDAFERAFLERTTAELAAGRPATPQAEVQPTASGGRELRLLRPIVYKPGLREISATARSSRSRPGSRRGSPSSIPRTRRPASAWASSAARSASGCPWDNLNRDNGETVRGSLRASGPRGTERVTSLGHLRLARELTVRFTDKLLRRGVYRVVVVDEIPVLGIVEAELDEEWEIETPDGEIRLMRRHEKLELVEASEATAR